MLAEPIEAPDDRQESASARPCWGFEEGQEIVPGRYALRLLGGGSVYETYLAWDDSLMFLVVVKLVRPHLASDAHALQSLMHEARMVARLVHPVLVRGFGAVMHGPRPHLVLEHLEGPHLSRLLRRHGPLPLEQLLPLGLDLCSALHYLRREGIVHLDVKPRNVIMSAPPRLIDLSVARTLEAAGRVRGPIGTEAYMAPEQCNPRRAPLGPHSDVWGMGATLYHAATGRLPFREERDSADGTGGRFHQLHRDPAPMDEDFPEPFREVVLRCLSRDIQARPAPEEVAHVLEPLVGALPRRRILSRLRPRLR